MTARVALRPRPTFEQAVHDLSRPTKLVQATEFFESAAFAGLLANFQEIETAEELMQRRNELGAVLRRALSAAT